MDTKDRLQSAANLVGEAERLGEASTGVGKYHSLNDAAAGAGKPGLAKGSTEIWYGHPDHTRELSGGPDWLSKHGGESSRSPAGKVPMMPTEKTLKKTHRLLGKIKETNPDRIFELMQGENWSPHGEARTLIKAKGLGHTSMSVGDIIKVGAKLLMVDRFGFYKL